jgi:hypothetical protein
VKRAFRPIALGVALFSTAAAFGTTASNATTSTPDGIGRARAEAPVASALPVGFSAAPALPAAFPSLWDVASAYDSTRSQVVLFGGVPQDVTGMFSKQTWLFSNQAWVQGPAAPAGLTARGGAAMAFLPDTGQTVLFGGSGGAWPPLNDTWLFDGSRWTAGPSAPPALSGRYGAAMVYDPAIHKLVLFGGSGAAGYNDTWLFDGTKWTKGPAAPAAMVARAFAAMVYDPSSQKVLMGGGDGGTDAWWFDGTTWSAGPSLPYAFERFHMDYDPDVGGIALFGGVGPSSASKQLWKLAAGAWTQLTPRGGATWPTSRVDPAVVFNPAVDALMVIGGIDAASGGVMFREVWYYVASAPAISSISLTPSSPTVTDKLVSALGTVTGGSPPLSYAYTWYRNGQVIAGQSGMKLDAGIAVHGDAVYVQVQATDSIGLQSAIVRSNTVTVVNLAPSMGAISVSNPKIYTGDTVGVTLGAVRDLDGDAVTVHYVWSVNGVTISGFDSPTLPPDKYGAGDSVSASCTPTDSLGLSGSSVTAAAKTVAWRLTVGGGHAPGTTMYVTGHAYAARESVDIRTDSVTGTLLGTAKADATGAFTSFAVTLPNPYPGGVHTIYGIGRSSALQGTGQVTITPIITLSPNTLAAGTSTTVSAVGFKAGETVGFAFPGGSVVNKVADANGSAATALVSPPEPSPSGLVTASALSATAQATYYTMPTFTITASAKPGDTVPIAATGFGPSEQANVTIDSVQAGAFTTGADGSLSSSLTLNVLWGSHNVKLSGVSSGAYKVATVDTPAWMTLDPTHGGVGTTVTLTSGPGWTPNELTHLKWNGTQIADLIASPSGVVSWTFTVPSSSGTVTVTLLGTVSGKSCTATFEITIDDREVRT